MTYSKRLSRLSVLRGLYLTATVTSVDNQRGLRLVNVFRQGFYRVAYGREFWNGIMDQLLSNYTVRQHPQIFS